MISYSLSLPLLFHMFDAPSTSLTETRLQRAPTPLVYHISGLEIPHFRMVFEMGNCRFQENVAILLGRILVGVYPYVVFPKRCKPVKRCIYTPETLRVRWAFAEEASHTYMRDYFYERVPLFGYIYHVLDFAILCELLT
jgi:hypothetical protein